MEIKRHGLLWDKELADQQDTDYLAGTVELKGLSNIASIPWQDRDFYAPVGEVQRAVEDTQACTSFSPSAGYKAMLQFLWDRELLTPGNKTFFKQYLKNGRMDVSEAYIAIKSGTTKQGNSLKAPLQAIRDWGMIPGHLLPLEPWMTWEDYHNPKRITKEMEALGKECATRLIFNYERVYEQDYEKWLIDSVVDVGGYGWPFPDENGVHQRVEHPFTHAFLLWNLPKYQAFDSYPDTFDGDFKKNLAPNYKLTEYGYRLLFTGQQDPEIEDIVEKVRKALMQYGLSSTFANWLAIFYKRIYGAIWSR